MVCLLIDDSCGWCVSLVSRAHGSQDGEELIWDLMGVRDLEHAFIEIWCDVWYRSVLLMMWLVNIVVIKGNCTTKEEIRHKSSL